MSEILSIPGEPIPAPRKGFRVTTLMVVVLVVGGAVGMLGRSIGLAREAARASQCLCISQIALALHNYHGAYGSLPPAYVADSNGKPMHSWRVLLLPFMAHSYLYNSYDMTEPWNGPNNRKLLDLRPNFLHCPSRSCGATLTSYVAITGPKTAFPGTSTTKFDDIRDGTSRTILIAEVANVEIPWTEPRDLDTETMSWLIDDPRKPSLSSPHRIGPAAIFADGRVRRLKTSLSPEVLKAMTTIAGGEPGPEKPR